MKLSVCITVKNRVELLKRCIDSLELIEGVDEIVVSDWNSTDTDFSWYTHKLVKIDEGHFSVGHGKNVAAAAATGDILFFLDADLVVPQRVVDRIKEWVEKGRVFAPIMHMQNEDGSLGQWAVHSFGQVALSRKEFESGEKWQPWKSYGGEDNLFIAQYKHKLVRSRIRGFIHQWHPHELREKYGEHEAYRDLKQFDKEFEHMKIYAHDPRFVFNGRYNSFPDSVVVREIWCENVYEVFDGDLSDTGVVVDLGANIGAFSLYAAMLGAKKVIAVEPETHNLELLRKNIDENSHNTPDCEFVVDARGIAGEASTGYIDDNHGDSRVQSEADEFHDKPVELITLEQLWKTHDLEFVDILKIDIEGLEGEVIKAAPESLLNLCRYITLEFDQSATDLGELVEKISKTHQIKYVGASGGMLFARRF